ncbi:hypothetical protein CIPAW_15G070100 [Carya illinoinensis]|uniref:Uncharacterized protein n=1 Tax=Carya illinoinensis TaxID=32201 RepID=A0A8T1NAX9_CARIL|nr:hypothetical protein CIPAW_15G070100 [Carya illinoinensis]
MLVTWQQPTTKEMIVIFICVPIEEYSHRRIPWTANFAGGLKTKPHHIANTYEIIKDLQRELFVQIDQRSGHYYYYRRRHLFQIGNFQLSLLHDKSDVSPLYQNRQPDFFL